MWMSSKIKSVAGFFTKRCRKVGDACKSFVTWMGKGYIFTKSRQLLGVCKDTFANATHNGVVSSGMKRSCDVEPFVYLSDIDGSDIIEEFKTYIEHLTKKYPKFSPAVNIYINSGVYGMYARTEMVTVMVYNGIPFIFPVHRILDGIDENDAQFYDRVNSIISKLYSINANQVASLGVVDDTVNVTEYVLQHSKKSPIFASSDIDASLVQMAIRNGTITSLGSLYFPGGYLYDIYAIDPITSKAIRNYKDFSKNPLDEVSDRADGKEVILVGGDPDIVCVGDVVSFEGYVYDAWIPNDVRYYRNAVQAVESRSVQLVGVSVDDDEYLESYAFLLKMMTELEEEATGPAPEDSAPDILHNVFDDQDVDEVPVLLELPEYLL